MCVTFHESDNDHINFQVAVQANIGISGKSRRDYDSNMVDRWFSISCSAVLRDGIHDFTANDISDYSSKRFNAEDALTKYLVSYVYAKDLDKHAEKFLQKYCPQALEPPMPLPIEGIISKMGITVFYATLPDGVFGQTYFNTATWPNLFQYCHRRYIRKPRPTQSGSNRNSARYCIGKSRCCFHS